MLHGQDNFLTMNVFHEGVSTPVYFLGIYFIIYVEIVIHKYTLFFFSSFVCNAVAAVVAFQ